MSRYPDLAAQLTDEEDDEVTNQMLSYVLCNAFGYDMDEESLQSHCVTSSASPTNSSIPEATSDNSSESQSEAPVNVIAPSAYSEVQNNE